VVPLHVRRPVEHLGQSAQKGKFVGGIWRDVAGDTEEGGESSARTGGKEGWRREGGVIEGWKVMGVRGGGDLGAVAGAAGGMGLEVEPLPEQLHQPVHHRAAMEITWHAPRRPSATLARHRTAVPKCLRAGRSAVL